MTPVVPSVLQSARLGDARRLEGLAPNSVDLVVTSPPYPMIAMWDEGFRTDDPRIEKALDRDDGPAAFELMHEALDAAWAAAYRVLKPGGLICCNIGDATRTIDGVFRLYSNHARILECFRRLGLVTLPDILWRKVTNAPNKFMGSGMLPCGAYVTYEHEYVLIARKGEARKFPTPEDKEFRRAGAYFWEERNVWFSDLWDGVKGSRQEVGDPEARERSAAFPLEVPYRLILMYSCPGDVVLDPFLGAGTTLAAAAAAGRNGVGFEREAAMIPHALAAVRGALEQGAARARRRLDDHRAFVTARLANGGEFKHRNVPHEFPVITGQEVALQVLEPVSVAEEKGGLRFTMAVAGTRRATTPGELPFDA